MLKSFYICYSIISIIIFDARLFSKNIDDLYKFSAEEKQFLSQFSLKKVPEPAIKSGEKIVRSQDAARLGKKFFFDKSLSANKQISCASCHNPQLYFTDAKQLSIGISSTTKNSPSILFSRWSPWQFWDGRADSLWSQAIGPLTDAREHGLDKHSITTWLRENYFNEYQKIFPHHAKKLVARPKDQDIINQTVANIGKLLMAYQFQLKVGLADFDYFIDATLNNDLPKAKSIFNKDEITGMRLFMGKANCVNCHNGPLLTNFEFHNVGVPEFDKAKVDLGRYTGVNKLRQSEFTCLSSYSQNDNKECQEMRFLKTTGPELVGAFKTPSLRNVAHTAPYMHSGQLATLEDVINHYDKPKPPFYDRNQHPNRPHFDILPLKLSDDEKQALLAFLQTLSSPIPKDDPWWQP